ncbi:MAG TPA: ATP-binding cassette domain-containing protein [Kofleriaceae bacterium]|nr:ATP-binding cassette domain-containing protein [Kofleriaceae bacterium]
MLQLVGVAKRYASASALAPLDLRVEPGELIAIVGPSGSGKSTALRVVAGLIAPSEGAVIVDGRDVTGATPARRDIAIVRGGGTLYAHLNVRDNVAFALRARMMPDVEIARRVAAAVRALAIDALVDRFPQQLSSGQRQRVALAGAVARAPRVFQFDDPLQSLDARVRADVRRELRACTKDSASMYVTHDLGEAIAIADRIVVLRDGCVQQIDTPSQIRARPANAFVAEFFAAA